MDTAAEIQRLRDAIDARERERAALLPSGLPPLRCILIDVEISFLRDEIKRLSRRGKRAWQF